MNKNVTKIERLSNGIIQFYNGSNVIDSFSITSSVSVLFDNNNPKSISFVSNVKTLSFDVYNLKDLYGATSSKNYTAGIDPSDTGSSYVNRLYDAYAFIITDVIQGCCPGPTFVGGVVATYPNFASFPVTGQESVIYIDESTRVAYFWNGTTYQELISASTADKMVTIGRNSTGSTLYKGTVIYISGSTGNRPNYVKAQANSEATSAGTFGVILDDIPNNSDGYAVTIGTIDNLDTRSTATHPFTSDTLADGDTIYLSPTTAGYVTNVKPYAPSHLVYVGKVVRTSPTNGVIVYRIQNGYELDEIHDVAAQTPSNNDGLFFESATSLWKNKSISTVLGYTPVPETRTLTINGTTQDLSANRTFTIAAGVSSVTASAPIASSGGSTPNISISQANSTTDGYLSSSDWLTFNNKFNSPSGTTLQYVRGDGTLATFPTIPAQYNPTAGTGINITGTYPNQTITNSAPDQTVALTAGTGIAVSGTYPNFTITNSSPSSGGTVTSVTGTAPIASSGGATPAISIATANGSTTGALTSTDWNTFNNKQATLVSGTNIKTLEGQSLLGSGNIDLTKSDVGLANVDNTSDLNKPISTATQTALNAKQDTLTLTTTGTSGAATLVGSTLNIPQYGGGGGGGASVIDIQTFTSSGVWTKPAGAKQVEVYIFGAGGGGGSGRRGAASSARYGGGGGSTGSVFINKLDASAFSSTENIWIGAGGTSGAARTTNDINGANGGSGGDTYFGGTGGSGDAKIIVTGGTGGSGGTNTSNGSGTAPFNTIYGVLQASNTYASQTNNSNGFGGSITFNMRPLTSGVYGGGIDTVNNINNGSSVLNRKMNFTPFYTTNGGVAPGGNGDNGVSTFSDINFVVMSSGGGGGASGDAAGTIAGGRGGNGAICCGGGGGGASTNGANSGAGGTGGNGLCIVITYF